MISSGSNPKFSPRRGEGRGKEIQQFSMVQYGFEVTTDLEDTEPSTEHGCLVVPLTIYVNGR